ncbi:MAG: N-acetyltransferase [Clostridia bacterium]|nr:N-acetyltransferase [Clostridia bacterium]
MAEYIHESSYVDDGAVIGDGTKIWHFCHIQKNSVIGKNCTLGQNVNVSENVTIGNNVKIQNNVSVYEGVTLEDGVFCGPSCVFTNDLFPRSFKRPSEYYKTLVKAGASLGANSTVVCGVTIGRYALIAAGAVVTKDVPDYALMLGIPARQHGYVCKCGTPLDNNYSCTSCNGKYYFDNNNNLTELIND